MPLAPSVPRNLLVRIQNAIPQNPHLEDLLQDIAIYIEESSASLQPQLPNGQPQNQQNASKKRKLENDTAGAANHPKEEENADSISDISFSIPQRKKLKLSLGAKSIRASNPQSEDPFEFGLVWTDVEYCVCLPVPEKAQPQWNFCIFPREGGESDEQILFTVPGGKVKGHAIQTDVSFTPEESYKDVVKRMLDKWLKKSQRVLEPDEKEFTSQVAQAHRKGEKAVHVKAFRGSKDGYLFFLPHGIIWGFKKPLEFHPFHAITSISYTSVLQRTFNLNVTIAISPSPFSTTNPDEPTTTKDLEFSMIDQADFASIDAYIKRHDLQDASMAEQRRAKRHNVNGVKTSNEDEDGGEDGEGELQKAAREAEEMEDEDEEEDENFDPGSEGESEGSGSSSEEEDGAGEQAGGAGDGDIAEEELGSEMEDVSE